MQELAPFLSHFPWQWFYAVTLWWQCVWRKNSFGYFDKMECLSKYYSYLGEKKRKNMPWALFSFLNDTNWQLLLILMKILHWHYRSYNTRQAPTTIAKTLESRVNYEPIHQNFLITRIFCGRRLRTLSDSAKTTLSWWTHHTSVLEGPKKHFGHTQGNWLLIVLLLAARQNIIQLVGVRCIAWAQLINKYSTSQPANFESNFEHYIKDQQRIMPSPWGAQRFHQSIKCLLPRFYVVLQHTCQPRHALIWSTDLTEPIDDAIIAPHQWLQALSPHRLDQVHCSIHLSLLTHGGYERTEGWHCRLQTRWC